MMVYGGSEDQVPWYRVVRENNRMTQVPNTMEADMNEDKWAVVGRLIAQTVGEPRPGVYTRIYASLTQKEVCTMLNLEDEHSTHTR